MPVMAPVNGTFCVTVMHDRCLNARMAGKCATCVQVCPHEVYTLDGEGCVHVRNYNACVGCRICAEFCPKNVLEIDVFVVKVARPEDCIKCMQCELLCPDFAIKVHDA